TRGAFHEAAYRKAMRFYVDLFRERLAPAVPGQAIANLYQEFERGTFAMYITGPWQLGEFRDRLSPAMRGRWAVAPLPGPDGRAAGARGDGDPGRRPARLGARRPRPRRRPHPRKAALAPRAGEAQGGGARGNTGRMKRDAGISENTAGWVLVAPGLALIGVF